MAKELPLTDAMKLTLDRLLKRYEGKHNTRQNQGRMAEDIQGYLMGAFPPGTLVVDISATTNAIVDRIQRTISGGRVSPLTPALDQELRSAFDLLSQHDRSALNLTASILRAKCQREPKETSRHAELEAGRVLAETLLKEDDELRQRLKPPPRKA